MVVMPFNVGQTSAEKSGRDSAQRRRPALLVRPFLEVLETRCLMSGWHQPTTLYGDTPSTNRVAPMRTERVDGHAVHHRGTAQPQDANKAESAPGGSVSLSAYGAADSSSNNATALGPQALAKAAYVLVPEMKAPHRTFSTAQVLPDLPYFGVVGTLGAGDLIDLYRLTLNAAAAQVDFEVSFSQFVATIPMHFTLFDASGQVLGEWSTGSAGAASLHAELNGLPPGSTVYAGISIGNSGGSAWASATSDYQLWVSIQSTSDGSTSATSAGTAVPTSAVALGIGLSLTAPTNLAVQSSTGNSQATAPSPANDQAGTPVAVGSPAMRSARPAGGLLSDGNPAPPAARDFSAAVNKEWDEPSLTGAAPRVGSDIQPTALAEREKESDALVVTRGPGGFPLLGAVAIGHRPRNSALDLGDFSPIRASRNVDPKVAVGVVAQDFVVTSDIAANEPGDQATSQALSGRGWAKYSVSVFSGLGLATVFTLNAVFSQPIAGFDYLTSRMEGVRARLKFPTGRRRKSTVPPHGSSALDSPRR
jgi:hypothetical protein